MRFKTFLLAFVVLFIGALFIVPTSVFAADNIGELISNVLTGGTGGGGPSGVLTGLIGGLLFGGVGAAFLFAKLSSELRQFIDCFQRFVTKYAAFVKDNPEMTADFRNLVHEFIDVLNALADLLNQFKMSESVKRIREVTASIDSRV